MTSDEKLIKAYEKAKKELERKLRAAKGSDMRSYYRKLIKEIEETVKELQKSAAAYVNAAVSADYMENAAEIYEQMRAQSIIIKPPEAFRQLHTDAIYDLRREVMTQIEEGIAKAKQQTERLVAEAQEIAHKAALRSMGLDAAQHKIDTVGTVTDMQQELVKRLEETGILKVELGSGKHKREMSITNYAHLVARSTSREVGNTARINQMSANGFDLVEIPPHYPTCEICAILQDRVYSISGEDKRFPPLSKAIGVYKNIHPHCRHVIVGWAEMMYTPEEIEEAIKKSNRPWTDPRSGEEKQFYNELQNKNRRARDLQYQYERYKKRLGDDAPKSLYAFKRIKKAGGERWEELQNRYRQAGHAKSSNYAKYSIFNYDDSEKNINIKPQEIIDELNTSEIGRAVFNYLEKNNIQPRLVYSPQPFTHRGKEEGGIIHIYLANIKSPRVAAQTIIHETTHLRYGIGQSQWAEAVCMANEKLHIVGRSSLTIAEKRYIISLAKQFYPEHKWRKGGYVNGRRKYPFD